MTCTRRHVLASTAVLALSSRILPAHAAGSTPRDWLVRWLAAFNAGDAAVYPAFVRQNIRPLVPYLDEDLGMREGSGGFILLRTEETGPREITAWLRDRNWDRFSKVVLTIGADGIDDLSFAGAPDPHGFAIPRLSERDALAALRRTLRAEATAGRLSGAVLVAKRGKVLLREAYGAQDATGARPVTAATRFCIGSAGKMFTAVGVLQLVQQGRLRLTDTIAMRLPDYPDTSLAREVSVRHLLTHSGGTGDFFGPDYETHAAELLTPSDFILRFGRRDTLFPPGSRWGYSNFGFILLGALIERASGQRWDAYLKRNVFDVAGMTETSPVATAADTARPLTGSAETGLKSLPYYPGLPAGGGYSTVDDLHRFAIALRSGALLDAEPLRWLTTASIPAGSASWSFGLRIATRNGAPYYGHGGSAPGVNADIAFYPAGYTVIALANRGHPHALNIGAYAGNRLPLR
ncbi:serine hydrolase domain-containing protein [Sphingomonas sp.]|uniref:serine hydrolase domain-containing protein n=1 Tax=Sphingomonas sp. TaxID=28214 RepID=UPI0035C84713